MKRVVTQTKQTNDATSHLLSTTTFFFNLDGNKIERASERWFATDETARRHRRFAATEYTRNAFEMKQPTRCTQHQIQSQC